MKKLILTFALLPFMATGQNETYARRGLKVGNMQEVATTLKVIGVDADNVLKTFDNTLPKINTTTETESVLMYSSNALRIGTGGLQIQDSVTLEWYSIRMKNSTLLIQKVNQ